MKKSSAANPHAQVVCVHGFLGEADDWQVVAKALSKQCDVYCVSLFGDGDSLAAAGSLAEWAQRFNQQVVAQTSAQLPRILLGYSLGGRLALHAYLQNEELWAGLGLLSTNVGLFEEDLERRLQNDHAWAHRFLQDPWDDVVQAWNGQEVFKHSSGENARLEKNFSRARLAHALNAWSVARHEIDALNLLSLSGQILWLVGERDEKYVQIHRRMAVMGLPGDFGVIPAAGHRLLVDQPELTATEIVKFIDRIVE